MITFPRIFTFVVFCFIVIGFYTGLNYIRGNPDDTDGSNGRSGLTLYTDALTGCQYLRAGIFSGITPRMKGTGKQLGCMFE